MVFEAKTHTVPAMPPKAGEPPARNHLGEEITNWGMPTKFYAELMDKDAMREAIRDEVFYGSEELMRKNSDWVLDDATSEAFMSEYLGYEDNKPRGEREFTFIVYGASGYTGQLTLEYICKHCDPTKVKFALAGRTAHKVEAVKKKVFAEYEWKGVDPPVIGASLKDPQDVRRMVQRCDVMVNIAGPFMLTGAENLVEACLLFDTDYVDVNGEIPFTHKLLEYHEYAEKNNVMVVPNAAFAGGATDVLATYAVDKLAEIKGKRCNKCVGFVTSTGQLAPSGGTVATREAMAGAMRDHGHLMMDPFSLGGRIGNGKRPEDQDKELQKIAKADMGMTVRAQRSFSARARSSPSAHVRLVCADLRTLRPHPPPRSPRIYTCAPSPSQGWVTPFMYSFFETRLVRRSNYLRKCARGKSFGKGFNFRNHILVGSEKDAKAAAAASSSSKKQEEELEKAGKLFKQGEGEDAATRATAQNKYYFIAEAADGERLKVRMSAGEAYEETGHMAVEVAICLALHRDELEFKGGVLTPSMAGGEKLVENLHKTGMLFDVMG